MENTEERELTVQNFIDDLGHEYDDYIVFFNWFWIRKNDYYGIIRRNFDDDYSTNGDVLKNYRSGAGQKRIFAVKYRDLYKDMVVNGTDCKTTIDKFNQQIYVSVFWYAPDVYYGQTQL